MRRVTAVCLALAALWSALLFVGAATIPFYSGSSVTVTSGGTSTATSTSATLLQENGPWVLVLLSFPAAIVLVTAGLLIIEPRHRWAGWAGWVPVGLVGVLTLLGMLTIGIFLVPLDVLLAAAVLTATSRQPVSTPPPPGLAPPTPSR